MALYLGLDTSNYTTSAALYHRESGRMTQEKRLLPVREGAVGQRQSEAVFGHVKALAGRVEALMSRESEPVAAVAAAVTPTGRAGSYMPCFLVGEMAGRAAAAVLGVPFYGVSHQAGHLAAAAFGAGRLDLLEAPFLAFHVSGGTTECLLAEPDPHLVVNIRPLARSLDLHGGQAVDRVGAMLGLPFPAGPALEELAAQSGRDFRPKPALKGGDCCLSGLENQCEARLAQGESPADVARYCLCFLRETLLAMAAHARRSHPTLPLLFAGGVMSNQFLQGAMGARYPGAVFAPAAYSADNGAGVAALCALRHQKERVS